MPRGLPTWLSPYLQIWMELVGQPHCGKMARFLKPLHDRHGEVEVAGALRRYCQETATGDFVSIARFAETFNRWRERRIVARPRETKFVETMENGRVRLIEVPLNDPRPAV